MMIPTTIAESGPSADYLESHDYKDPRADEYTINIERTDIESTWKATQGRTGSLAGCDIVHLWITVDDAYDNTTVTMEMAYEILVGQGIQHSISFVDVNHQQKKDMLNPQDLDDTQVPSGYIDEDHELLRITANTFFNYSAQHFYLSIESLPPLPNLTFAISGKSISFTFPTSGLLSAGISESTAFGIFGVVQWSAFEDISPWVDVNNYTNGIIVWDTAGLGAAPAPNNFHIEESEVPSGGFPSVGIISIIAVASIVVILLLYTMRRRSTMSTLEEEPQGSIVIRDDS
jgi:hypothetical protein